MIRVSKSLRRGRLRVTLVLVRLQLLFLLFRKCRRLVIRRCRRCLLRPLLNNILLFLSVGLSFRVRKLFGRLVSLRVRIVLLFRSRLLVACLRRLVFMCRLRMKRSLRIRCRRLLMNNIVLVLSNVRCRVRKVRVGGRVYISRLRLLC